MNKEPQSLYQQWVEDYYEDVYRWCLRYAGNPHDAADLTQETFTSAFRHFEQFRGDSSVRTWLLTIATRAFLRSRRQAHWRWRSHDVIDLETWVDPGNTEDEAILRWEQSRIWDWVRELPDKERVAISLFYGEELSYQEVATVMDATLFQVRNYLHRGRERLKKRWQKEADCEKRLHR
ncbi:RNA polymerase sigma factor [Alicyclobacillus sp. ALC3]|uniref:RNA polymerase sigma factor n=1 Tax=Alicyclobacillus sp. ALC3 TaxID=2796143 RepID=UPI002379DCA6|nr:RNA polymerase sigma factor [Alicyclobacillus sp. ALC3]WDL98766.1 RNA polymerase sigma factor [Alicyclobacillus sp. ALC3]